MNIQLSKATEGDRDKWNEFVAMHGGSFMQSWQWGEFKNGDTQVLRVIARRTSDEKDDNDTTLANGTWLGVAQLYKRPLRSKRCYYYLPRGPVARDDESGIALLRALPTMRDVRKRGAIFLRIDSQLIDNDKTRLALQDAGYVDLHDQVEPRHTIFMNLTGQGEEQKNKDNTDDENALFGAMKYRARRKINRARKEGVEFYVAHHDDEDFERRFDQFWDLMVATADRKTISLYSKAYYASLFQAMGEHATLHFAIGAKNSDTRREQQPLTANLIIAFGRHATYLFGATSREAGSVGAPYYAQYQTMIWAKNRGCTRYDLWGVSRDGWPAKWRGITFFKESFGGERVSFIGAFDYVFSPLWYKAYRLIRKFKAL